MARWTRQVGSVFWPAFLGASALEAVVFAFVDPLALHSPTGGALALSATAVYSIAFFVFWLLAALTCVLTLVLERGADELNDADLSAGRPADAGLSRSGR